MQKSILPISFLFLFGCGQNATEDTFEVPDPVSETTSDLIVGSWNMDSSAYINNGIRETVSEPILPTTWTFDETGDYTVKNSMTMKGSYTRKGDSLFVILLSVPNNYEIVKIDLDHLELRSTIYENESGSMKTDAYLTRKY